MAISAPGRSIAQRGYPKQRLPISPTVVPISVRKETRHKTQQLPVILVTGGAQGIGKGIAAYFLNKGWRVVVLDRDAEAEAVKWGGHAMVSNAGIADPDTAPIGL